MASALGSDEAKRKLMRNVRQSHIHTFTFTVGCLMLLIFFLWLPMLLSGGNEARGGLSNVMGTMGVLCSAFFLVFWYFFCSIVLELIRTFSESVCEVSTRSEATIHSVLRHCC